MFGNHLEAELEKAKGKTDAARERARKKILDQYLSPESPTPSKGLFADPASSIGRS